MVAVTARKSTVLRWQAELIDCLADERPGNQTRILAVAAVLVKYANPDGTQANVGQRRIAHDTGQDLGRVNEALGWLVEHEWVTIIGRIARGGHRRTLMFPASVPVAITLEGSQRSGEGHAGPSQRSGGNNAETAPAFRLPSGKRSGGNNEPPTSDQREEEEDRRMRDAEGGAFPVADAPGGTEEHGQGRTQRTSQPTAVSLLETELALAAVVQRQHPHADIDDLRILAQIRRLADGGWLPEQYTAADHQPLPERSRNPTALAASRLRKLPTDPNGHVGLQVRSRNGPKPLDGVPEHCWICGYDDDDKPVKGAPRPDWISVTNWRDRSNGTRPGWCQKCFDNPDNEDRLWDPGDEDSPPRRHQNIHTGQIIEGDMLNNPIASRRAQTRAGT